MDSGRKINKEPRRETLINSTGAIYGFTVLEEATVPITVDNEVESEVMKVSKYTNSVSRPSSFPSSSPSFHTISPISSVKEILPHQDWCEGTSSVRQTDESYFTSKL